MELRCPHCKTTFQVDENDYAAIAAQVKNAEFEAEIRRRMADLRAADTARERARVLESEKEMERRVSAKEKEKAELEKELASLQSRLESFEAAKQAELALVSARSSREKAELSAEKEKEINRLQAELARADQRRELEMEREKNTFKDTLHAKDSVISELSSKLEAQSVASENRILELNKQHAILLQNKDEEIARYKDMKTRLSTKLLGETLEVHCQTLFNRARSQGQFLSAYFEKDNDASIGGTKGDFIFRDFLNGEEYISIMFEMKNEDDRTATKHRNEDFFAKLDKDRREKACEYAVLVSMLEADSEFYNEGIVDVSYRFDKMFVVRPQCFMSVISMLSRAARRSAGKLLALRNELELAKAQSIDVTNFEARRDRFVEDFGKLVSAHLDKQDKALSFLDKAIQQAEKQAEDLRKIKQLFEASRQKLVKAHECAENDFTIKKLTRGNPTMKAKFDEARNQET